MSNPRLQRASARQAGAFLLGTRAMARQNTNQRVPLGLAIGWLLGFPQVPVSGGIYG
jgi:hypothetical protein